MKTDQQIAEGLIEHKDEARSELYTRFRPMVYGIVHARIGRFGVTDDIVNDIFIKALEGPHPKDLPEALKRWLVTISLNKCTDFYRTQSSNRIILSDYVDIQEEVEEDELTPEVIEKILEKIPTDEHREVFRRVSLGGERLIDVAASMDMNLNTAKSAHIRAKRHLKKELIRIGY